jgi:hypothetical protein
VAAVSVPAGTPASAADRVAAHLDELESTFGELLVFKVPRVGGVGEILPADVEDKDILVRLPSLAVACYPGRKSFVSLQPADDD